MSGALILLDLAGYVGLLLWGTHMVTTGVQRGFGADLRRWLGKSLQQRWRSFLVGVGITALLQSSTATGLMVTSFVVAGFIGLGSGLGVMLGANVGTTLITQVLSFDIAPVAPPLILGGVLIFRSSNQDRAKNIGRMSIGLGLMLMALAGLVHTLAPIERAPILTALLSALGGQPVLAIIVAAALTWACHSSVAIVLLTVSLAETHVVGTALSLALVLGANLGGALPPLLEAGSPQAKRLPLGNALIRLIGCVLVLPALSPVADLLTRIDPSPARLVVNFHTAFNLALAILFVLFTDRLAALLVRLLPDPPGPVNPAKPVYLEPAALTSATVALANAARETLRMADLVQAMLTGAMEVFRQDDRQRASEISHADRSVDRLGGAIRHYLADLGNEQPLDDQKEGARTQEILSAVINLEHIGDIVANNLMDFAVKKIKHGHVFSQDEAELIARMHAEVLESLRLGTAVFLNGEGRDAVRLTKRKVVLRQMEADAMALHAQNLRKTAICDGESIGLAAEHGGLFLRIVRDLRRIHSHIATLGYATLGKIPTDALDDFQSNVKERTRADGA